MKIYLVISGDSGYSENIVKSFLNEEKALKCVKELTIESLHQEAYEASNLLKKWDKEITQKNIERLMNVNLESYSIQELEVED